MRRSTSARPVVPRVHGGHGAQGIRDDGYRVALTPKELRQGLADRLVVIHDQDLAAHEEAL